MSIRLEPSSKRVLASPGLDASLAKILGERGSHEQVQLDDQDAGIAHRSSPEDF
jgi:hypothetical protein